MNNELTFEDDLLASIERGEWRPVRNQKKVNAQYRELAAATLSKSRRVNIRITAQDLERLQARAAEEGLPYQTLMASVLHKYVSGRLVDGSLSGTAVNRKATGKTFRKPSLKPATA